MKKTAGLLETAIVGGLPTAGFPLSIEWFKIAGFNPESRRILSQQIIGQH